MPCHDTQTCETRQRQCFRESCAVVQAIKVSNRANVRLLIPSHLLQNRLNCHLVDKSSRYGLPCHHSRYRLHICSGRSRGRAELSLTKQEPHERQPIITRKTKRNLVGQNKQTARTNQTRTPHQQCRRSHQWIGICWAAALLRAAPGCGTAPAFARSQTCTATPPAAVGGNGAASREKRHTLHRIAELSVKSHQRHCQTRD